MTKTPAFTCPTCQGTREVKKYPNNPVSGFTVPCPDCTTPSRSFKRPNDPDPRNLVTRDFHRQLLYAFHVQGHLLSDDDSAILEHCIEAYHRHTRLMRNVYYKAKDILRDLHNRS